MYQNPVSLGVLFAVSTLRKQNAEQTTKPQSFDAGQSGASF
jgi:hypothetical protein